MTLSSGPVTDMTLPLRPAAVVMQLERLGSFSPTRLSFARRLTRLMYQSRWQISCVDFDLDEGGYGSAIYRLDTAARRYHVVVFSRHIADEQRTDRVIADTWDLTFGLVEGEVDDALMASLVANMPLQEAGRQHPRLLVLSRANRSVRNFEAFVAALAAGDQPDVSYLLDAGYLYRTTAVYGNGKFGIADYDRLRTGADFYQPFSPQMTAVYVLREFSVAQVEHIARLNNPAVAVELDVGLRRYLGIGNSTGLGMAPFLINHPQLINYWVYAREQALAVASGQSPVEAHRVHMVRLCRRAMAYFDEMRVEDSAQAERNTVVYEELDQIVAWLEQVPLEPSLWRQLMDWAETSLSLETQELINTLLIECYPDEVDALDELMSVEEKLDLSPDMPLVQLKQLLETHFDWAIEADFDAAEARYWFWYQSAEKEEPRLGVRGEEAGEEKALALAIAPRAQRVYRAITDFLVDHPRALTIDLLLAYPEHMKAVRRIQTMVATAFGEIRANLWHRDMKPMHLLRTKLSFLGAHRFDPRGDRWVRVTFFQGAPVLSDFEDAQADPALFDDWSFPLAPRQRSDLESR